MKTCPKCGRFMFWSTTGTRGFWQCVCGYDTRFITYTYGTTTKQKYKWLSCTEQGKESEG